MKKSKHIETKKKLVIDTNVVVSALLTPDGTCGKILQKVTTKDVFTLCISEEVFYEYKNVLSRSKFTKIPNFSQEASLLLLSINATANYYLPSEKLELLKDFTDNKFLELANESKADYLITGNIKDFHFNKYKNTKIITPSEFIKIIK